VSVGSVSTSHDSTEGSRRQTRQVIALTRVEGVRAALHAAVAERVRPSRRRIQPVEAGISVTVEGRLALPGVREP
jgi:hypothetical protein